VQGGLYESLLTERLHRELSERPDLHPDIKPVDDGEQPLTIARHLTPLIERSLRAAATAADRAELVHRILAVLPDPALVSEELYQREPGKIERLDEVLAAGRLGATRLPRPATPLSDTALMTNAHNEPTHIAFARGAHTCPGAPLARVEGRVSLERILDRMGDIRADEAKHGPAGGRRYSYAPTYILRGLTELNIQYTPIT
jgi:hypothetical protein